MNKLPILDNLKIVKIIKLNKKNGTNSIQLNENVRSSGKEIDVYEYLCLIWCHPLRVKTPSKYISWNASVHLII